MMVSNSDYRHSLDVALDMHETELNSCLLSPVIVKSAAMATIPAMLAYVSIFIACSMNTVPA